MWTLALGDQLYWLLPNRTYTIGRAHDSSFVVSDASVSRKHAEVRVVPPTEDAYLHPSVKSDLIITDLQSRFGTIVDKKQIKNTITAPHTPHNTIGAQLGRATKLHFRWNPLIVTVCAPKKDTGGIWDQAVHILKPLDAKIVPHIVQNTSVFCQASELITSSLYYALVRQIPVVNFEYLGEMAAYAQTCSSTGVKTWALPDSTPFSQRQWEPNAMRSECFASTKFSLRSDINQDNALKPILEAGGAQCAENGWYLLHKGCSLDELHIPLNSQYVDDSSIFTAILESRKLRPAEIKIHVKEAPKVESNRDPAPKRARPRGSKLLDLMTQSQPKEEPKSQSKKDPGKDPVPVEATDKLSSGKIPEPVPEPVPEPPATEKIQKVAPKKAATKPKSAPETNSRPKKITARKRTREQTDEAPAKKMKSGESDDDEEPLDLTKEQDPSFEPALVESSLTINRNPPPPLASADHSGKANFKAFKKTQVTPRVRIELDAELPEQEEEAIKESDSEVRESTNEPITPKEPSTGIDEEFGFTFS